MQNNINLKIKKNNQATVKNKYHYFRLLLNFFLHDQLIVPIDYK